MCINFRPAANPAFLAEQLGPLDPPLGHLEDVFPGYQAHVALRRGAVGDSLAALRPAQFGLVPHWCTDATKAREISRKTYNARSETAASKPSFRSAWAARQWVLVPMDCFFEPCWEDAPAHGGRPVRWRIASADGTPFAVAGLWDRWADPATGSVQGSFTVLTVNADGHGVMDRMHRPDEEKRMPAILPPERYADWLQATPQAALGFLQAAPADWLYAEADPLPGTPPRAHTPGLF